MIIRYLLLSMLLTITGLATASDRLYVRFELKQGESIAARGNDYTTKKPHTWSKGIKSSYLRLRCEVTEPGKFKKFFSTVDHYAGTRVTHQLVGDKVEVTVSRSTVKSQRAEIHDLPKDKCENLAPVVATTTETYSFNEKECVNQTRPFGENMSFRFVIQSAR